MDEDDREWKSSPGSDDEDLPGDEDVPGDEDLPDAERDYPSAVAQAREQAKRRRLAVVALIIVTVGVAWALVLGSIFVVRSGDRTAELISILEAGQQQRGAAFGDLQQSQEERQAALETQQETRQAALEAQQNESQMFRAQELAALAEQAKNEAEEREALANAVLANSEARRADAEAALAEALAAFQANRAERGSQQGAPEAPSPTGQLETVALEALTEAIEALKKAIKKLSDCGPRC